ncbi:MAG: citrate lyase acyl carrier protein [Bacilli bacterium]
MMKIGVAGTLESSDVMITVRESDALKITIESIVFEHFSNQIYATIVSTLQEMNLINVEVLCQDKGALDYVIKARLKTAIERMHQHA